MLIKIYQFYFSRCDHFREQHINKMNVIFISIKNGKHFDGHLGCHPVSMQLPKDASLAFISFVMYSIPS